MLSNNNNKKITKKQDLSNIVSFICEKSMAILHFIIVEFLPTSNFNYDPFIFT